MPDIAIKGSLCTGHDGFPPRPSTEGQPLFTVNHIPVMVTGNAFALHSKPDNPPHSGTVVGSSHLIINGKNAAMVGDSITCGSKVATGQPLMQIN